MSDEVVTQLSEDECWQMLREEELGRLAFRMVDEVHIAPVNFAVDHDTLLFRTAGGEKLLAVAMGSEVAFEVDRWTEDSARSVVVRGSARILPRTRSTAQRTCRCGRGWGRRSTTSSRSPPGWSRDAPSSCRVRGCT